MNYGKHFSLDDLPPAMRQQAEAQLVASRRAIAKPERSEPVAVAHESWPPYFVVDPDSALRVRIVRQGGRRMDHDNLVAGCKTLRDAIADAAGRKTDSEADGWTWEYEQRPGEIGMLVEVYHDV